MLLVAYAVAGLVVGAWMGQRAVVDEPDGWAALFPAMFLGGLGGALIGAGVYAATR